MHGQAAKPQYGMTRRVKTYKHVSAKRVTKHKSIFRGKVAKHKHISNRRETALEEQRMLVIENQAVVETRDLPATHFATGDGLSRDRSMDVVLVELDQGTSSKSDEAWHQEQQVDGESRSSAGGGQDLEERGSAESRGDRRYAGGCEKDGLWSGGGSRQIPAGLSKKAANNGNEDADRSLDRDNGGQGSGGAGGGGGGDDDGDDLDVGNSDAGRRRSRRRNAIPLNKQQIAKIRPKLATYRTECENLQFESGLGIGDVSGIVARVCGARLRKDREGPHQLSDHHSEQTYRTDFTTDTEDRGFTLTFDRYTEAESEWKIKKQLDPVLKARKDVARSIGTCQECRRKKVKVRSNIIQIPHAFC